MSMSRKKILFLAQFALLLAIELIFCFTPLGSIPIVPGLVVATLAMVPVVITAILLGTGAGAAMALSPVCALLVWSFITPAPTSFVFTPIHSLPGVPHSGWSLVICFVPRILTGVVAGLCASAFGRSKHKALRSAPVAYGVSAALGSLTNTFLVLGGVYLFFGKEYAIAVEQPYGLLLGILGLSVLTNGIPEAVVAFLASVGVCTPVKRALKKGGAL